MKHLGKVCKVLIFGALIFFPTGDHSEAQTCITPPSGMIGWWSGDTDANDISGNENHATLKNGAQAGIPGMVAAAFEFDGIDDVVDTPIQLPSIGTLDLWLKPNSLDDAHGIIGTFGDDNGNDRLWIAGTGPLGGPGSDPNRLPINLGSCCINDIDIPNPFSVGTWTHLALTFDYVSDNYSLYINGQSVGSSTASRNAPTGTLSFGGFSSTFGQSFFLNGLIDEVEIFNRVLDDSEILAIYNAGVAGKCKDGSAPVSFFIFLPVIFKSPNSLEISNLTYQGSDEYVEIRNNGPGSQSMNGWQIVSVRGSQTFDFPNGIILGVNQTVRVHSGPNAIDKPPGDLLWSYAFLWNNNGDKAELRDDQGIVRDTWCYLDGCP